MTTGTKPKISIVTPSFNQAEFLEEAILSVLGQGYPNLEYVVIDGGSSDSSPQIVKKYEHHLHFATSERDDGHGHALNKGFTHTSGDIMAWINSDDKYTAWSFQVVADIFTLFPHVNWIVGFNSWWNSQGAMTSASRHPKNIYDFLLGNYDWVQQESVFWRRSLWEKAGGYINQDYRFMVDGELWTRFFLHDELYSVDCILSGYRIHSKNRAISNYQQCLDEMNKAVHAMRQCCSDDVLRVYSKLKLVSYAKRWAALKHLPISGLSRRILLPATFKTARYRNISYHDEKWTERYLPFSV